MAFISLTLQNGDISQHISTPISSANKICIRSCTSPQSLQSSISCENEFRYPTGCEGATCDYIAKWEYNKKRKDVKFDISAKEIGRWTGIGLSRDGSMVNSDVYTGWVYEGKGYVTDRFAYGRQLPAIDPADRQDIYEVGGRIEDDVQTITFRRKVLPADTMTDFPLNKCYYFLFPIGGGRVLARKSQDFQNPRTPIGYHDLYQPRVSRTKICICDQDGVPIGSEESTGSARVARQAADPFEVQIDPFLDASTESRPDEPIPTAAVPKEDLPIPQIPPELPVSVPTGETEHKPESPSNIQDHSQLADIQLNAKQIRTEEDKELDCMDMVIGSVVNGAARIMDYFAIPGASVRPDTFYDAEDSLTSAAAYEYNGVTTVVFRKPLKGYDKADHSITPGPMTVFWAKGPSQAEGGILNMEKFMQSDVPIVHEATDRGVITIDFLSMFLAFFVKTGIGRDITDYDLCALFVD
ncbi:hypothetical protein AB6A40_010301 [Gnathostoma spinigerum]|uniref:DOMON domain-containing protein n=1 Tax=Gnathostoma spinigerum TaxID=75299 RepID=A0ABD6EWU7_9BILA